MIISMRMHNIALIEDLTLEFGEGLHVMTGETGAGKSIVVDAVNLVLGGRADRDLIRTGTEKAWVEAVFDAGDNKEVAEWAKAQSLEDFDGIVTLYREMTRTGRNLYAVGSNAEAAKMRGVPINRIRVLAHTICGATAGLAGIMWLAFYAAIEKGSALGDEMFTIAACVLGGVAVTGGYGKITGVVIGALMIAFIDSAIPQMGIGNSMITEFIKGILLLVAILLNVILQRIAEKQDLARRNI